MITVESSTNEVEESITYENTCKSKEVICEKIVVECESKKYKYVEVIKLVNKQVEEKKLEIQSIIKNEELMIYCDYTNNLNHIFLVL